MSIMVESIKRLYASKKITKKQLKDRVEGGVITPEEYQYITGENYK